MVFFLYLLCIHSLMSGDGSASAPVESLNRRAAEAAGEVALLLPRAKAAFDAAIAETAAVASRLIADVERAVHAKAAAEALLSGKTGAKPTKLKSETGADGTVFELHEGGMQLHRRTDGACTVVFGDDSAEAARRKTVGQFPASTGENAVIQISEGDDRQIVCQFVDTSL